MYTRIIVILTTQHIVLSYSAPVDLCGFSILFDFFVLSIVILYLRTRYSAATMIDDSGDGLGPGRERKKERKRTIIIIILLYGHLYERLYRATRRTLDNHIVNKKKKNVKIKK